MNPYLERALQDRHAAKKTPVTKKTPAAKPAAKAEKSAEQSDHQPASKEN